jgi:hypothetical protein
VSPYPSVAGSARRIALKSASTEICGGGGREVPEDTDGVRLHAGVPAVHVHGLARAALPAASWLTIQDTDVGADREEERVLAVGSKAPQDEARVLLHLHVVRARRRGRGLLHRKDDQALCPSTRDILRRDRRTQLGEGRR